MPGEHVCQVVGNVGQVKGEFINESGNLMESVESIEKGAKTMRLDALF